MTRRNLLLTSASVVLLASIAALQLSSRSPTIDDAPQTQTKTQPAQESDAMTTTISSEVDAFVADQNQNRGGHVAGGGSVPLDYNALTGTGTGNAVTGVSGIASGAPAISLPSSEPGDTVIIDGAIGTSSGSYSLFTDTSGDVTLTDNSTGNSQSITGASYLVFDGGAKTTAGAYQQAYIVASGINAEIAEMYNAAFKRVPDFAGLEFYSIPTASGALSLHQDATYFLGSPEFKTLYPSLQSPADNGGPNDQAFINQLYGQILHRTPSASEVQFYVNAVQNNPGTDRATLLEYFSVSPENQADVAAGSGGWLINPSKGVESFGNLSGSQATTLLAQQVSSGTINASSYLTLSPSASVDVFTDTIYSSGVTVSGANPTVNGTPATPYQISTSPSATAGLIIDLSSPFNNVSIGSPNVTVNVSASGGTTIFVADSSPIASYQNFGGTINLAGNGNTIVTGNMAAGGITVPTIAKGWNSTDVLTQADDTPVVTGTVLTGHVSGAILAASANGYGFQMGIFAINVGAVADDTTATMVTAANAAYTVADAKQEHAYFFGQDPHGNTMVFFWKGDAGHTGTIQPSDISGAVELVGVQASSLTGTNFHQ